MRKLFGKTVLLASTLAILLISSWSLTSAQAEDPPMLSGAECYQTNWPQTGWSNSFDIRVALEDVTGDPLWVDIDEDPNFGSPTTVDYSAFSSDSLMRIYSGDFGKVHSVGINPDGSELMTSSYDSGASLLNIQTGEKIFHFDSGNYCADLSPDGNTIATGNGRTINLWNANTGEKRSGYNVDPSDYDYPNIYGITFSPDSGLVMASTSNGKILMRLVPSLSFLRRIYATERPIRSVVYNEPQTLVVAGSDDGTARILEKTTGKELLTLFVHGSPVYEVGISSDSSKVLTVSADGYARLWNAQTGTELLTYGGHNGPIKTAKFSPDGAQVLTGSDNGTVQLWDTETGEALATYSGHSDSVLSSAYRADGSWMLTGGADGTVRLWDMRPCFAYALDQGDTVARTVYVRLRNNSGASSSVTASINLDYQPPVIPEAPSMSIEGQNPPQVTFSWSEATEIGSGVDFYECQIGTAPGLNNVFDGNVGSALSKTIDIKVGMTFYCRVRATDLMGNVGPWSNVSEGAYLSDTQKPQLAFVLLYGDDPNDVGLTHSRKIIIQISSIQGIPHWVDFDEDSDFDSPTVRYFFDRLSPEVSYFKLDDYNILDMDLTTEGSALVGCDDHIARLLDPHTGLMLRSFAGHESAVGSVAMSGDGSKAITGSDDMTALLWDTQTGALNHVLNVSPYTVNDVALNWDGAIAATANGKYPVIWDTATGTILQILQGHSDEVRAVAISRDGSKVLTGGDDLTARLWDVQTGNLLVTMEGHTASVIAVALSLDGTKVATGSDDGTARLWDLATGQHLLTYSGYGAPVRSLAFSPDSHEVLTGGGDHNVHLYDVVHGTEVATYAGHGGEVTSAAFFPANHKVITLGLDNALRVWSHWPRFEYTLDKGGANGLRKVYVRLRNDAGKSGVIRGSIMFDYQNAVADWALYR